MTTITDHEARHIAAMTLYRTAEATRSKRDASGRLCARFLASGSPDIAMLLAEQAMKHEATIRECSATADDLTTGARA